jgi:hypothetical protein
MEKPIFELMSNEEFYAIDYKGKSYTLQHTHNTNPNYYDNTIYNAETGNKIKDENLVREILEAFSDL